ncbi:MAG: EamA family transporter [Azospirillaceae bacterium]
MVDPPDGNAALEPTSKGVPPLMSRSPDTTRSDDRASFTLGLVLVAAGAALWATVGVASRYVHALTEIDAASIGFYRLAFAVPGLALAGTAMAGRRAWRIERRGDLALLAVIGLAVAGYQTFYFAAVARAGVAIATIVTLCGAPVLVGVLAAAALGERPTRRLAAAGLAAIVGTALLVGWPEAGPAGDKVVAGGLIATGSALAYAVFAVTSRRIAGAYPAFIIISLGFGAGAVVLAVVAGARGLAVDHPPAAWAVLAYMGLVPTALAYVLFYAGIRRITATVAGLVTLVEPLTATALAAILFGERLGPTGAAGAGLLIGGLALLATERQRSRQR